MSETQHYVSVFPAGLLELQSALPNRVLESEACQCTAPLLCAAVLLCALKPPAASALIPFRFATWVPFASVRRAYFFSLQPNLNFR